MTQPQPWIPFSNERNYRSFQLGEEPEIIHIIKTGFVDRYLVVQEDAYELVLGKCDVHSKKEIEEIYKIKLDI